MTVATSPGRKGTSTPASTGLIHFPEGLLGFPHTHQYQLALGPGEGLFWLIGIEPDDPTFLVGDPFRFFEGFSVELSQDQQARIGADDRTEVAVLAITVPGANGATWTANTQGPIVINVTKGVGAQLVLTNESEALRRPFHPILAAKAS